MKFSAILSLAVASLAVTQAATDPCTTLGKQATSFDARLTYDAVKGCYLAQPYDAKLAAKVLASVEALIGNFYAFIDMAKVQTKAPFDTPVVNLHTTIQTMKKTVYKTDYDFNMALTYLMHSLNDGHASYMSNCYQTVSFTQPISLYAPVINGKQAVRVYYADPAEKTVPSGIVDCEVQTIDGVPALKAVQAFADKTSAISKDPSVRLNDAFASVSWYFGWATSPGGFSKRWALPDKSSMNYIIKCDNKAAQNVTVPWIITPSDYMNVNTFTSQKTYWAGQCLAAATPSNSVNSAKKNSAADERPQNESVAERLFRARGHIKMPRPNGVDNNIGDVQTFITRAKEVLSTSTSVFYTMNGAPTQCVAVVGTMEAAYFTLDPSDYNQFIQGLQKLAAAGCKKILFDFTNNGGGSVDFAYFLNQLLFPKSLPFFDEDIRAPLYVQNAAKAAIKMVASDNIFDARTYASSATRKRYTDATMFTKGVNQTRGGSTSTYTQRNYFTYAWPFLPLKTALPWKATDMAIVTNGFCGSSCSMVATRFALANKVKTYAIGGINNKTMSFFSFPGGFSMDNDGLISSLKRVPYTATGGPVALPIQGYTSIAMGEIYRTMNTTIPLEYDYKYFGANVHLPFDTTNARHPDVTWQQVFTTL